MGVTVNAAVNYTPTAPIPSEPATSRGNAAKPVSLHPLGFEEAIKTLLTVDPADLRGEDASPSQPDQSKSDGRS